MSLTHTRAASARRLSAAISTVLALTLGGGASAVAAPASPSARSGPDAPSLTNPARVDLVSADDGKVTTYTPAALPLATTVVSTQSALVSAVERAEPGDVIAITPGVYHGGLKIRNSGTKAAPITLRPTERGAVTITMSPRLPSCGATGPDGNRAITFQNGASHWNIMALDIVGGVMIASHNSGKAQSWLASKFNTKDWRARRAVPGRGSRDRQAADRAVNYLSNRIGRTIKPSDGISLVDNTITVKGIHTRMARYGHITGNTITEIACGTGPGIWLGSFSDGWKITNNNVSKVAASTKKHFMQEGIRIGGASNYNVVANNVVAALPTGGRAFTTDQDASYNTFRNNLANGNDISFNDQMSGWNNRWIKNSARNYRESAFSLRAMDSRLESPSFHSSPYQTVVRCNHAVGPEDFKAGAMREVTVTGNAFGEANLSSNLRSYFTREGNTWDGLTRPPSRSQLTGELGPSC